ncbi:50S ribosomal protein L4 [Patescibacteria group bacterium]|nr:50S ribosomal protein L4 [Patescibacteria group bacterium]MBU1457376.1 50S ribosomal protein L4 [Patescibacteria group bacterium]
MTTTPDFSMFKIKVPESLLAQAIYVYQSNSHQDTSKVKTRGEIVASKRKIYKQKGTGRARHGALSAPIFVGGGIAHGPTGLRPKRKKLNSKMKNKALVGALSLLQQKKALALFVIPAKAGIHIKTKDVIKKIPSQPFTLVQHQASPAILKAFSNIKSVKIIPVDQLNAYHVLQSKKLLFTPKALEFIKTKLNSYL